MRVMFAIPERPNIHATIVQRESPPDPTKITHTNAPHAVLTPFHFDSFQPNNFLTANHTRVSMAPISFVPTARYVPDSPWVLMFPPLVGKETSANERPNVNSVSNNQPEKEDSKAHRPQITSLCPTIGVEEHLNASVPLSSGLQGVHLENNPQGPLNVQSFQRNVEEANHILCEMLDAIQGIMPTIR
jgi:hypothetical protein